MIYLDIPSSPSRIPTSWVRYPILPNLPTSDDYQYLVQKYVWLPLIVMVADIIVASSKSTLLLRAELRRSSCELGDFRNHFFWQIQHQCDRIGCFRVQRRTPPETLDFRSFAHRHSPLSFKGLFPLLDGGVHVSDICMYGWWSLIFTKPRFGEQSNATPISIIE